MLKPLLFILSILLGLGTTVSAQNNRAIDPCKIFGAVYIEKNRIDATYRVYIEESEAFANLLVFKQENKLFTDKAGQWYFTPMKGFADFSIYIETNRALADFFIFYTPTESFAGCNN
jgi:hypothetical protein